jgi:TRAP transporter TAXI family solute receptor
MKRCGLQWNRSLLGIAFMLLLLSTFGEAFGAEKMTRISIGTAQIGGVYYPYGGAIASVISKYIPGVEATAEVTNGVIDNAKFLQSRKIELALMSSDVTYEAHMGIGVFKEKVPIRNLISLHKNVTYIICLDGKGINSVQDLRGKRVSLSAPGSSSELQANRILEAYGIDPRKDIKRERLSASQSSDALKDGKIDAFFWNGGIPGAAILDLAATPGIKLKFLDHGDIVPKLIEKYGKIYINTIIPSKTYHGIDYDVSTLGIVNYLVCHEKTDETLAYNILKVLFEHRDELIAVHPVAKDLKLETAMTDTAFPYHSGAIKYYKEKGLKVPF